MNNREILKIIQSVIDVLYHEDASCGVARRGCYDLPEHVFKRALINKIQTGDSHLAEFDEITWNMWDSKGPEAEIQESNIDAMKLFVAGAAFWPTSLFPAPDVERLAATIAYTEERNLVRGSYAFRREQACLYTGHPTIRRTIFKRDGKICRHCGAREKLTLDHIIPVFLEGTNTLENLQVLCRSCNSKKSNKHPKT